MDKIINPEVKIIEQESLQFPQGHAQVQINRKRVRWENVCHIKWGRRSTLSIMKDIKDIEMVRGGFLINRHISDAKGLFTLVDKDDYLSLPSSQRLGITHELLSDIDIMAASILHNYTCVFRWYMLLIYHLQARKSVWSPTSKPIDSARKFCSEFLYEKNRLND